MRSRPGVHRFAILFACIPVLFLLAAQAVEAGVIFGNTGLSGGARWDAAPRTISSNERSLDGGLRYSLEGGSYEAYRDLFTWGSLPTVPAFQQAVEQAFSAWTSVDPVSGLGSNLSFVADLGTAVIGGGGFVVGTLNVNGAEIDLFAENAGDTGTRGAGFFNAVNGPLTLTSGTTGYSGFAISGADVTINSNPGAIYNLDLFRRLLTHELGHAIGLGDVENSISPGVFIDDNYDGANGTAALATLTNSWAGLVNPLDQSASPLSLFTVNASPGTSTTGVDILMESSGLGIATGNPVTQLIPLQNDDYGTRQFLYPFIASANAAIPEPSTGALLLLGIAGFSLRSNRRAFQRGC